MRARVEKVDVLSWTKSLGQPDYHRILGWSLVLVPTVGTYVEWHYIDNFSANKCQHFEGTGRTLWSVMVPSNALKGFPSVTCERGFFFFAIKNSRFLINIGHKTAAAIDESEEYNDGVFLPFLFSWLTCGACWLSGGGLPFAHAPRFSGGVCDFGLYWFWRSRAEDLLQLFWQATGLGQVRYIEECGIQHYVRDRLIRGGKRRSVGDSALRWWWWGQCRAWCLPPWYV